MRLLDYGASSKERARALLREIRSLQVPFRKESSDTSSNHTAAPQGHCCGVCLDYVRVALQCAQPVTWLPPLGSKGSGIQSQKVSFSSRYLVHTFERAEGQGLCRLLPVHHLDAEHAMLQRAGWAGCVGAGRRADGCVGLWRHDTRANEPRGRLHGPCRL